MFRFRSRPPFRIVPIFPNEACLGFKCDQLVLNIPYKKRHQLDETLECSWNSLWAAGRKQKVCEWPSMLVFPITNLASIHFCIRFSYSLKLPQYDFGRQLCGKRKTSVLWWRVLNKSFSSSNF